MFLSLSYLGVYCLSVLAGTVIFSTGQITWIGGTIRAARSLHEHLATAILSTTLRFLDKTPVGRIIQRFTKDVGSVDNSLSQRMQNTIQLTWHVTGRLIVIVWFAPAFMLPSIALAIVGVIVGQLYIKAQLPIKRYAKCCTTL